MPAAMYPHSSLGRGPLPRAFSGSARSGDCVHASLRHAEFRNLSSAIAKGAFNLQDLQSDSPPFVGEAVQHPSASIAAGRPYQLHLLQYADGPFRFSSFEGHALLRPVHQKGQYGEGPAGIQTGERIIPHGAPPREPSLPFHR